MGRLAHRRGGRSFVRTATNGTIDSKAGTFRWPLFLAQAGNHVVRRGDIGEQTQHVAKGCVVLLVASRAVGVRDKASFNDNAFLLFTARCRRPLTG